MNLSWGPSTSQMVYCCVLQNSSKHWWGLPSSPSSSPWALIPASASRPLLLSRRLLACPTAQPCSAVSKLLWRGPWTLQVRCIVVGSLAICGLAMCSPGRCHIAVVWLTWCLSVLARWQRNRGWPCCCRCRQRRYVSHFVWTCTGQEEHVHVKGSRCSC